MSLPQGAQPVLIVYVQPDGNLGVQGPINEPHALLEVLGKAMLVLAQHHAKLAAEAGPKLVIAKPVPPGVVPQNGNPHPPLRRI